MAPTNHSRFGASSAERWVNCPGSVRLSVGKPNRGSFAAAEGSVAHTFGERLLKGEASKSDILAEVGTIVKYDGFDVPVTDEMIEGAILYHDTVMKDKAVFYTDVAELRVEERLHLVSVDEDAFGTSDAIVVSPKKLIVYDFKYGKGKVVEVENNKQMMFYGIGAMDKIGRWDFEEVELVVVQPRGQHKDGVIRRWTTIPMRLDSFAQELKAAIAEARKEDSRVCAGDWCRWCPANPCPALAQKAAEACQADFSVIPEHPAARLPRVEDMPVEVMLNALAWEETVSQMFDSIKGRLMGMLEAGESVPGMKLVASRSNRVWKDEEQVKRELGALLPKEELYTTPKLLGPAAIEKKVGKKTIEKLTEKPEGKPALAPESDPRPALPPVKKAAADDFAALPGPVPQKKGPLDL